MRYRFQLTAANPTARVNLDFDAVAMIVSNPTGSPVYVRIGSNEIPNQQTSDWLVSAFGGQCFPVVGRWFGVGLADGSLVGTIGELASGALGTCTIMLLDRTEVIPTFGSVSYLSLSTSELTDGIEAFTPNRQVYDMGGWGGALVYVSPSAISGQALIALEASDDAISWRPLQTFSVWPSIPSTVNVPRVARFLSVWILATGIPAEPNPDGFFSVRGTLEELSQLSYAPSASSITKNFNITTGPASVQYLLSTSGLGAVSIGLNLTSGTSDKMSVTIEAASSVSGPWRMAAIREQQATTSGQPNLYRSVGSLDQFMRVTVVNFDPPNLLGGAVSFSILREADLSSVLERLSASIGDSQQDIFANTGQTIRNLMRQAVALLTTINTSASNLSGMATSLVNIDSDTNSLPAIQTNTSNAAGTLTSILTQDTAIANTVGPFGGIPSANTLIGRLGQIRDDLAVTISGILTTISTTLTTWITRRDTQVIPFTANNGAGGWVSSGVSPGAGKRLTSITVGFDAAAGTFSQISVGVGSAGAVMFQVSTVFLERGNVAMFDYVTRLDDGYNLGANTTVWMYAPGTVTFYGSASYT